MTTRTLYAAGAALLAFGAACSSKEAGTLADTDASQPQALTVTPEQRQRIHVVAATAVAFRPVVEATGNVAFNGDRSTQVLSPVSGPATRVIGTPGMLVHRGEPLAYVSSPDFASAVADYRKAQSAFRNAKRGQAWHGPVYFRKETEPYMTIAIRSGSDTGPVTIADVNLKFIWDVVSRIRVGDKGKAYVVDGNGFLIADPDIGLVLRKTNLAHLPHVKAAGERQDSGELAMFSTDLAGAQVLTSMAPM